MSLDRRLYAYRPDLADARLRGRVEAARFVQGQPACVTVGEAPVLRDRNANSELDTFYHYGEKLLVFELADGCAWCQSLFDGYVGYAEAANIVVGDASKATHYIATLGSYTYAEPDLRSPVRDLLPRHAAVVVTETGVVTRGTEYARLGTGDYLPSACLSPKPPRSRDIVAAAELYLGCPYRWAGRSARGIDCSGLVQNAFRDIGQTVPRDTDMQRDTIGEPVTVGDSTDLQRGDLIYMPGHVQIYAGGGDVLHADGASMMVRRENLAVWLERTDRSLVSLTIRRPNAVS